MTKRHALSFLNGPGICGAGQGAKARQRVRGTPVDQLVIVDDFAKHVDCARCLTRLRKRFPAWFEIGRGLVRR